VFGDEAKKMFEERILKIYDERAGPLGAFLDHELIGFAGLIPQVIDQVSEIELAFRIFPLIGGRGLSMKRASRLWIMLLRRSSFPGSSPSSIRKISKSKTVHSSGFHVEKKANYNGFITDIYVLTSSQ